MSTCHPPLPPTNGIQNPCNFNLIQKLRKLASDVENIITEAEEVVTMVNEMARSVQERFRHDSDSVGMDEIAMLSIVGMLSSRVEMRIRDFANLTNFSTLIDDGECGGKEPAKPGKNDDTGSDL